MTKYQVNDQVNVLGLGTGWINKAWKDDSGEDLYLVQLDNTSLTPMGYILARNCELIAL